MGFDERDVYVGTGPMTPPVRFEPRRTRKPRLWLHALLFVLTLGSAMLAQLLPLVQPGSVGELVGAIAARPDLLVRALAFAGPLLTILLAHELGHYVTAQHHGVDQSLPFFIPAPTTFGTLGAVILMHGQPANRRVLLDVAVMGPFAGLVVALPMTAWGLAHSTPISAADLGGAEHVVYGSSLLFAFFAELWSPNGTDVLLHPVALAGWVGLFVTSLNLIPAAQLDGGHVAYALAPRQHRLVTRAVTILLFVMGVVVTFAPWLGEGRFKGSVWIAWALVLALFAPRHPPVRDEAMPLGPRELVLGWLATLVFLLTFVPAPVQLIPASLAHGAP